MYALRCTQKLLRRARVTPAAQPPQSETLLGDWYANLIMIRPTQLVLCVSSLTLLPVVVPASPALAVPARLVQALEHVLRALEIPTEVIAHETSVMSELHWAKTVDRWVVSSMRHMCEEVLYAPPYLQEARSWVELAVLLATEFPCGSLDYQTPAERTRALLG